MSIEQKEAIIRGWDFPWPEFLGILLAGKDEHLKSPDVTEEEKLEAERVYELEVDRLLGLR
jgi:hypothetical protein